jgi:hypothetical protein
MGVSAASKKFARDAGIAGVPPHQQRPNALRRAAWANNRSVLGALLRNGLRARPGFGARIGKSEVLVSGLVLGDARQGAILREGRVGRTRARSVGPRDLYKPRQNAAAPRIPRCAHHSPRDDRTSGSTAAAVGGIPLAVGKGSPQYYKPAPSRAVLFIDRGLYRLLSLFAGPHQSSESRGAARAFWALHPAQAHISCAVAP